MRKLIFILVNLLFSTNIPVWSIIIWNQIFEIEDSIDVMAITGIWSFDNKWT